MGFGTYVSMKCVMSRHKEWRKIAKRERRRRIRRQEALQKWEKKEDERRKREASPIYQQWLKQQESHELFERAEVERLNNEENEKWLQSELIAQKDWFELQDKISKARMERAEQEIRIKKEWEREQQKIKEMETKIKAAQDEKKRHEVVFAKNLEDFLSGDADLPEQLQVQWETNPNAEPCPFFTKTAACRFGDSCSRNHRNPGVSKVLLAANFYIHFGLENSIANEYDTDILLEYDDNDTYKHFVEFFEDVLPEFERWGEVVQFKVCINHERHLRGNTYVEFASLRSAVAAQRALHARWYGGRQMSLRFCNIASWKAAICGMFITRRCPKGRSCNFMHVFPNPRNMFDIRDFCYRQSVRRSPTRDRDFSRDKENKRDWRWSESPEHEVDTRKHRNEDSRYREHRHSSSSRKSERRKHDRSRDRSRIRSPSQTQRKKERQSRSRETSRSSHRYRETPRIS